MTVSLRSTADSTLASFRAIFVGEEEEKNTGNIVSKDPFTPRITNYGDNYCVHQLEFCKSDSNYLVALSLLLVVRLL